MALNPKQLGALGKSLHSKVQNYITTGRVAQVAKLDNNARLAVAGYKHIATSLGKDTPQYQAMEQFVNQNLNGEPARVQGGIDLLTGRPVD